MNLHVVISQKLDLFITTAVRTLNRTNKFEVILRKYNYFMPWAQFHTLNHFFKKLIKFY
jgi:hypothetical protein